MMLPASNKALSREKKRRDKNSMACIFIDKAAKGNVVKSRTVIIPENAENISN